MPQCHPICISAPPGVCDYTPVISPSAFTSMAAAREIFGSPGMSIMFPAITTTKPAPEDSDASVMFSVQPVGAPINFGLSDREYCVFAMHTGNFAKPHAPYCRSFAEACSLNVAPAPP